VAKQARPELRNRLGVAMAKRIYAAYRELLDSPRWLRLANTGASPQRLLWASTRTKDPDVSDVLYVRSLAAPFTINTMPEETLLALADHGQVGRPMPVDGGDAAITLARFRQAGFDLKALADQLQRDGVASFQASWKNLLECIQTKGATLATSNQQDNATATREGTAPRVIKLSVNSR
jgi:transaldolase